MAYPRSTGRGLLSFYVGLTNFGCKFSPEINPAREN